MKDSDAVRTAAEYDAMAAEYDRHNAVSGANAFYERPATIELLGEVAHKRVLEVGCGSGVLTAWLADHGAEVVAFDISPAMLDLARSRLGGRATLQQADLREPLDFIDDASMDIAVASLVFHYLRDWDTPLRELHRVLRPQGSLVMSVHHPAGDWRNHCPDDYFAFIQVSEVWVRPHPITFWRRPLSMITEAVAEAGFVIERLVEPSPDPALATHDPESYRELSTYPFFLHLRLRPVQR